MGARGPLPQPSNIRQLRGNPSKRAASTQRKAPPGIPDPPADLASEARAEWDRVTPMLDELGLLAVVDRSVLVMYCTMWAKWCRLNAVLDDDTMTVTGQKGEEVKHPAWSMFKDATDKVTALAKELGIGPSTRLRMSLPGVDDGSSEGEGILD